MKNYFPYCWPFERGITVIIVPTTAAPMGKHQRHERKSTWGSRIGYKNSLYFSPHYDCWPALSFSQPPVRPCFGYGSISSKAYEIMIIASFLEQFPVKNGILLSLAFDLQLNSHIWLIIIIPFLKWHFHNCNTLQFLGLEKAVSSDIDKLLF